MIFVNKVSKNVVFTNYKVMFSTLNNYPNYEEIRFLRAIFYMLNPGYKTFFLKRSPYSRLESFYKDKIMKTPVSITSESEWQNCQKILLSHFQKNGFKNQKQFFENDLSYELFILNLEAYYTKDRHLTPQYLAVSKLGLYFGSRLKNLDINKNKEVISREILNDEYFNTNPTKKISFTYTPAMRTIINNLYSKDFDLLNYQQYE